MCEKCREDEDYPYRGSTSNFYDRVRKIREELEREEDVLVQFGTNQYSVAVELIGKTVGTRIHPYRARISHEREKGRRIYQKLIGVDGVENFGNNLPGN